MLDLHRPSIVGSHGTFGVATPPGDSPPSEAMKYLELDFEREAARVEAWNRLSISARDLLLALAPNQPVVADPYGPEVADITKMGLITHLVGTPRIRIAAEGVDWLAAMRSLVRLQRHASQSPEDFVRRYLHEHFHMEERDALPAVGGNFYSRADELTLALVNSATHAKSFFALTHGAAWEAARRPKQWRTDSPRREPLLGSKASLSAAQALLNALVERNEPVAWHELTDLLPRAHRKHIWNAVRILLRHLLAFGAWSTERRLPMLEVLPHVCRRLLRPPAQLPTVVQATVVSSSADLPGDVASLLVVIAGGTIRLKSSGRELFDRSQQELSAALPADDAWLTTLARYSYGKTRLQMALDVVLRSRFAESEGEAGSDLRLSITRSGQEWIASPSTERWLTVLTPIRAGLMMRSGANPDTSRNFVDPLQGAAMAVLALLPTADFVDRDVFLDHAARERNPLMSAPTQLTGAGVVNGWRGEVLTEEALENRFRYELSTLLQETLAPCGGLRFARGAQEHVLVGLTEVGAWLLGKRQSFPDDVGEVNVGRAIVQADFTITFTARSPQLEARVARLAERLPSADLPKYRITRTSIQNAAAAGLTAEHALADLTAISTHALPQNVQHEVKAWFGTVRRVALTPATLLRCPDAETAERVMDIAGKQVERISPNVLALVDAKKHADLVRKLSRAGVFVELPTAGGRRLRR